MGVDVWRLLVHVNSEVYVRVRFLSIASCYKALFNDKISENVDKFYGHSQGHPNAGMSSCNLEMDPRVRRNRQQQVSSNKR